MSNRLPRFSDLNKYANGQGDKPERFYLEFEQDDTDWELSVDGVEIPAHSQILGLKSKFFMGMLKSRVRIEGSIKLEGDFKLPEALATLRYFYDERSLCTTDVVHKLLCDGHMPGILRLLHKLDCPIFDEVCELSATALRTAGNAALVSIGSIAFHLNIDVLQSACATAVSERISELLRTAGTTLGADRAAAAFVRELQGCQELFSAGLLSTLIVGKTGSFLPKIGNTVLHLLDGGVPDALFSWKITRAEMAECPAGQRLRSSWFDFDSQQFQLQFYPAGGHGVVGFVSVHLCIKILPDDAVKTTTFVLRMVNWNQPTASVQKAVRCQFGALNRETGLSAGVPNFAALNVAAACADDEGSLVIQVASMSSS